MGVVDTLTSIPGYITGGAAKFATALGPPKPVGQPDQSRTIYGATAQQVPNPEWTQWQGQRAAFIAARASAVTAQQKADIQAQIDALGPEPPQYMDTTIGKDVSYVNQARDSAYVNIKQAADRIVNTGADAAVTGNARNDQAQQQANSVAAREAPTLGSDAAASANQQQTLERIRNFAPNTQGLQALRDFAAAPTGPSAAEAQLRLQSARDMRHALSLARSARTPGGVADALQQAEAENAATAAETRGQSAVVRATEEAQRRGETLQALSGVASGEQQASQQQLGALGTESQIVSGAREQDINVLRSNLDATMQQIGLNDNQVRFFSDLGEKAREAGINAQLEAQKQGIDATVAAENAAFSYIQQAWNMLTSEQKMELERLGIAAGVNMQNQQARAQYFGQVMGFLGTGLVAGATTFGGGKKSE